MTLDLIGASSCLLIRRWGCQGLHSSTGCQGLHGSTGGPWACWLRQLCARAPRLTYPAVGLSRPPIVRRVVKASMVRRVVKASHGSTGGPWACWLRQLCARAPGLTSVRGPGFWWAGDEMFDGVIPLGEALRPLDLSRRSTRVACRQQDFGSWPRRIGVSEGLARAKGWKFMSLVSAGLLAGTRCHTAQPKPGSSGQRTRTLGGRRGLGAARAAA
jgi:hypothetical protein